MTESAAKLSGPALRAPLSLELRAAAAALEFVRAGSALPAALVQAATRFQVPAASRAATHELAYRSVRKLGLCQGLADQLNARKPSTALAAVQLVGLAQLLEPGRRHEAVIVDQCVDAARQDHELRPAASFLNATLRRFLRERDTLLETALKAPQARWNHPGWWIERLRQEQRREWQQILEADNELPPMTLRVNRRQGEADDYLQELIAAGLPGRRIGPQAICLDAPCDVATLPGFSRGRVTVQDLAAQLAAPLLDVQDGQRVLDACAAPGGKTTHLLELADCELTAIDSDPQRLERVHENLDRLGLRARVLAGDAGDPTSWWDGRRFDRILLDAPCSASGILRRHPEIRWLRRRSDIATLSALQSKLLAALWPLLEPGGKLLYATCSVFNAEGSEVLRRFLPQHPDAERLPVHWRWFGEEQDSPVEQLLPCAGALRDHDGFFYALIRKRP
jgi:16S rRNA (cytosine967-C5)-methyltransferase